MSTSSDALRAGTTDCLSPELLGVASWSEKKTWKRFQCSEPLTIQTSCTVLGDYWTCWITGTKLSSSLDNSVTWIRRLLRKAVREMSTRIGSYLIFFSEVRWCSLNKEQQAQNISSKSISNVQLLKLVDWSDLNGFIWTPPKCASKQASGKQWCSWRLGKVVKPVDEIPQLQDKKTTSRLYQYPE
jgi:hypothetical protein